MGILKTRSRVLVLSLLVIGAVAFWATASMASKPDFEKGMLPTEKYQYEIVSCEADIAPEKVVIVVDDGGDGEKFRTQGIGDAPPIVAQIGKPYVSREGLKTVPLRIIANGGHSFAEGLGETRFWFDATRPLPSAVWEKSPGTEFPAIQEMRFHFFFAMESRPGKLYRTINPSIMRSDNVTAFPPPPGTVYRLMRPIELEEVTKPGVVAIRVLSNRVVIPKPRHEREGEEYIPM